MKYFFKFFAAATVLSVCFADSTIEIDYAKSSLKAHAQATGHTFDAEATQFECVLMVEEGTGVPTKAKAQFNVVDLKTGKEKRDSEMLHWMDAEHFGTVIFEFEGWKDDSSKVARGTLTIHGVPLKVEVPVEYKFESGKFELNGTFEIDTTNFGLEIIKKMLFLKVEPLLEIEFHIEGNTVS